MARVGGAAATPATGDPGGQGGPPPTAYTPGGCQWGSELESPQKGRSKPRAELSAPPSLLLPRGPERHTPTPGLARVGSEDSLPSPVWAAFTGGQRTDGGLGSRTLGPSWQDLTRASLTGKLPSGTFPCSATQGFRLQGMPPCPQPRTRALGASPRLPLPWAGTRSFLVSTTGSTIYLFCPAYPQHRHCPGPGASSFPPVPCPILLVPFLFIGQGEGRGHRQKEIHSVLGQGGHSNRGLSPFPWLGVDVIKRETGQLLALFGGAEEEVK